MILPSKLHLPNEKKPRRFSEHFQQTFPWASIFHFFFSGSSQKNKGSKNHFPEIFTREIGTAHPKPSTPPTGNALGMPSASFCSGAKDMIFPKYLNLGKRPGVMLVGRCHPHVGERNHGRAPNVSDRSLKTLVVLCVFAQMLLEKSRMHKFSYFLGVPWLDDTQRYKYIYLHYIRLRRLIYIDVSMDRCIYT